MEKIYHLNAVKIVSPVNDNVCGHCLLIQENRDKLLLVDTGIGLLDSLYPNERIGKELVEMVGYQFEEKQTIIRQIENLGLNPAQVTDCIISHLDNDHIGGIADFPQATVHLSAEELQSYHAGNPRYLTLPLAHQPTIKTYKATGQTWFGLEARKIDIETEAYLIPLFGHTLGHCGVALKKADNTWLFYIADAYYLRDELSNPNHPVHALAQARAEDNQARIASLTKVKNIIENHPEIEVFGYHDINEFETFNT